jgi:hypothetical protein
MNRPRLTAKLRQRIFDRRPRACVRMRVSLAERGRRRRTAGDLSRTNPLVGISSWPLTAGGTVELIFNSSRLLGDQPRDGAPRKRLSGAL